MRARSTRKAERLEKSRALQRVLYRSAKQDPNRGFHALYDKVARSDVLARAWGEVRANRGAPGVDGITIEAVEFSGVEAFLDGIAGALKDRTYRASPLRRVEIPKTGQPGKTRPRVRRVSTSWAFTATRWSPGSGEGGATSSTGRPGRPWRPYGSGSGLQRTGASWGFRCRRWQKR